MYTALPLLSLQKDQKGQKRQVHGQCFLNKNPIQPEMHPKEIDQKEQAGKVENNEAPDPTKKVFIMTVDV